MEAFFVRYGAYTKLEDFVALAKEATAYTNYWDRDITIMPVAFDPAVDILKNVGASLIREINNWASESLKYDHFSTKGSYTAEQVWWDAYEGRCTPGWQIPSKWF